jgi:hypothetical protein
MIHQKLMNILCTTNGTTPNTWYPAMLTRPNKKEHSSIFSICTERREIFFVSALTSSLIILLA